MDLEEAILTIDRALGFQGERQEPKERVEEAWDIIRATLTYPR